MNLKNKKPFVEKEMRAGYEFEVRTITNTENSEEEMYLEGYALKFNSETLIGSPSYGFREVILQGALDEADMRKVPLKYNHDNSYLALASTKNGSLELEVDDVGLKFKAKLIPTQSNKDVYLAVKEGLISECSFAFTIDYENNGSEWEFDGEIPLRKITKIDRVFDVAIVDLPAYEQTSVHARSLTLLEDKLKSLEDEKRAIDAAKKRMLIKIKLGGIE